MRRLLLLAGVLASLAAAQRLGPVIKSVAVPRYLEAGASCLLRCDYSYRGQPYSVRWYRNGKEFYSYVADKARPLAVHPTPGITVDTARSGPAAVALVAVSAASTGRYRCEVSGRAPMFATDTRYADLTVVTAPRPDTGPVISGARPRYRVREVVAATCSLARSQPAANLTWYINNQPVKEKYLVRYPVQNLTTDTGQQLHTASLGLAVVADRRLFADKRRMKLKCVASIFDVYHKINEISVEKIRRKRNQIMSESPAANQSSAASVELLSGPASVTDTAATGRKYEPGFLFNSAGASHNSYTGGTENLLLLAAWTIKLKL